MDKPKITFLIIILLIAIVFGLAWATGYYPIAFVKPAGSGWLGWQLIFAKSLDTNYSIALNFYKNQLKNKEISVDAQKEIKRATLQSLIEDKIIENEINKKIGTSEFKKQIDEKLNKIDLSTDEIKEGAKLLYGLSVDQLKDTVLTEQAKREIAASLFSSTDRNLADWLKEKLKSSKIIVLIPIQVVD